MARIVFDLDGTLIDSAPDLHAVANGILAEEGAAPITLMQARGFIGQGAAVFVAKMRAARNMPESAQAPLLARFLSRYETAVERTVPYPGVREVLEHLVAAGHRMGVCTNKPLAPCLAVLRHLGLERHFEAVIGGDSLPVHKPDPAPLRATFDQLGTGPVLYVGDSEIDAETAERAQVPFLLFTGGYRKRAVSEMTFTGSFDDFAALPATIDAWHRRAA